MPAEEVNDGDEYPDGNNDYLAIVKSHTVKKTIILQERSNPKKTTTLSDTPSLRPTNLKLHSGERLLQAHLLSSPNKSFSLSEYLMKSAMVSSV